MINSKSKSSKAALLFAALGLLGGADAHLAPFHKGMYCLNGNIPGTDLNSYAIVSPLYQLPFSGWWMHGFNNCNQYPPADGDFLDLPAGGNFMVEIASNRAKTTLSYNGQYTSEWPDGNNYPEDYNIPSCIISPNMHTQNQSMAAGTAFAISYESDINNVTPENLVVFSVRYNTPWKREIWYDVPAAMPQCPAAGCTCAWGWVPNGCGQPNIYQTPFRCRVTSSNNFSSARALAAPKAPVWCEDNQGACVKGAKQMIYWNQNERNNVQVSGMDLSGEPRSPGYNAKMGWADGAQNDIFTGSAGAGAQTTKAPAPASTPAASSAPAAVVSVGAGGAIVNAGGASASANVNNGSANANANANSGTANPASASPAASTSTAPVSSSPAAASATPTSHGRMRGSCSAGTRRPRALASRLDGASSVEAVALHKKRHLRRDF